MDGWARTACLSAVNSILVLTTLIACVSFPPVACLTISMLGVSACFSWCTCCNSAPAPIPNIALVEAQTRGLSPPVQQNYQPFPGQPGYPSFPVQPTVQVVQMPSTIQVVQAQPVFQVVQVPQVLPAQPAVQEVPMQQLSVPSSPSQDHYPPPSAPLNHEPPPNYDESKRHFK